MESFLIFKQFNELSCFYSELCVFIAFNHFVCSSFVDVVLFILFLSHSLSLSLSRSVFFWLSLILAANSKLCDVHIINENKLLTCIFIQFLLYPPFHINLDFSFYFALFLHLLYTHIYMHIILIIPYKSWTVYYKKLLFLFLEKRIPLDFLYAYSVERNESSKQIIEINEKQG